MHGIALPTHAVIVLVLATMVLGALVIFFFNSTAPQQQIFTDIADQTRLCQRYVRLDPECEDTALIFSFASDNEARRLLTAIDAACENLGYADLCPGNEATPACVQSCCASFCA